MKHLVAAACLGLLGACMVGDPEAEFGDEVPVEEIYASGWVCTGVAGVSPSPTGVYYTTSFGCWVDDNGNPRGDGDDNCIPWCEGNAHRFGTDDEYDAMCGNLSGPACERETQWYSADADRYGCMTRLKVTNPDNDKAVVVVVLDRGPSCTIERRVRHWVADLSYPTTEYLFGGPTSATERADVTIEIVPMDTPLGPVDTSQPPPAPPPPPPPPPPMAGDAGVQGVVYVAPDGANRIGGATVTLSTGQTATASASGYFKIEGLQPGPVTITASAPGRTPRSVTRALVNGELTWGSVGL